MKKITAVLLAALLCLSLCACGGGYGSGGGSGQTSGGAKTKNVEHVSMEVIYNNAEAKEKGVITAYYEDGTQAWSNETDELYIAELETIQEIGWFGSNYLFVYDGGVYCLDPRDGSFVWYNDEFEGAGASWCFDDDYNLYICGCYGPDLMVIDAEGNTLLRCDSISEDLFWPHKIEVEEYDGIYYAIIHFDNARMAIVDSQTGELVDVLIDTRNVELEYLVGTWADNSYDPVIILDIYDDGSYQLFRNDDTYHHQYVYEGYISIGSFYEDGINDWICTTLDYTDDYNFEGWNSIGDFLFTDDSWESTEDDYKEIYLSQINNGDSVFSMYLDTFSPVLVRIYPAG